MERIIDVYYDEHGLPFKDEQCTVHFPVVGSEFLGASQTTTIRFHYSNIGNDSNVYTVESKRPDGKTGSQLLSVDSTNHYAEMSLSGWYSACKGDLYLSLKVYQGGSTATYDETAQMWVVSGVPVIQSTGAIKLAINYTPVGRVEDYNDDYVTYQMIMAYLSEKLNVDSGIVVVNSLSGVNIDTYDNGQLFYETATKNVYQLDKPNEKFVKLNNKVEFIDVQGYEYEELYEKFGTNPFYSYFEETNNIAIYQFKVLGGSDYALYVWTYKNGCLYMPYVDMSAIFSINDFTNLEYEKAPVVELQSDIGTLSDLDYEKVLQPNASIFLEDTYFIKTYEDSDILEFSSYIIGANSINGYIAKLYCTVSKDSKQYRFGSEQELFYTKSQTDILLSGKQDKLVNEQNIKSLTIGNNQPVSLLGSGTINIPTGSGGSAEWGSIGGDIADQIDLQDELQDIREVAEGKTSTYVIYDDIEGITEQTFVANEYKREDGTPIATWADFLSYVDGSNNCSNTLFDNDSVYKIDVGYTYLITVYNRIIKTNTLKNGDNIIVVQLNVPDRWYNEEDGCAYPLETSKINLDNYSTKTETSTEVNKVAHDIAVEYDESTLYGIGDLCIKDKLLYKCNTNNTTGTWDSTKWNLTTVNGELGIIKGDIQHIANKFVGAYIGDESIFTTNMQVGDIVMESTGGQFLINEITFSGSTLTKVVLVGLEDNGNPVVHTFENGTWLKSNYINSNFVDLTTEQTITGTKQFGSLIKIGDNVLVAGVGYGLTRYGSEIFLVNGYNKLNIGNGIAGTIRIAGYNIEIVSQISTKIGEIDINQYYKNPQSSVSLSDGGTITDNTLKSLIRNRQPIDLNGFTCYFSCDDGTNYQYVSTRYDATANKNHINVITIDKSTWVATFHTSDIAV